ncbi:unnamed protein product [Ilex paraguariensis]|uniref:Protein BIG GRAIN 1-like B n=1 Tax=Ilex paraguariensis TaxID=185542 RepID=A0ABC8RYT2_9AQUA
MILYQYRQERENPSFSSTLLDAIYRSIDEGEEELVLYRGSMRKKQSNCTVKGNGNSQPHVGEDNKMASFQRAYMIEKWTERKVSEKVAVRRKSSPADIERKWGNGPDPVLLNRSSSSSSSDSSSGRGFSSSEAESVHGFLSCYDAIAMPRPKPIRTGVSAQHRHNEQRDHQVSQPKPKHDGIAGGGFVKTKSRASKIYSDLKKVKQPISPGGRLATFLNSLFSAGKRNAKKAKISSATGGCYDESSSALERKLKSAKNASTCSSASSFSRSCLSTTTTTTTSASREQLSSINATKRSVRFFPASVIVGEDCRPCGHKSLYEEDDPSHVLQLQSLKANRKEELLKFHYHNMAQKKNCRVGVGEAATARDVLLLKNYDQKMVENEFHTRNAYFNTTEQLMDDEDEDAASYASSDLFELDNLSAIGIDRYHQELPVYETTRLDANLAIANGLIL